MSGSNEDPPVSVVISNYNYGRYLRQAIDSVLTQSRPPLEVLVVDDGSTDGSEAVVRRYGDRVRWVQQHCRGVSAARNLGVQESRGGLITFLDADDYWMPEKLERQVARWRQDPEAGLVHCGAQLVDERGHLIEVRCDGQEGWLTEEMLLFKRSAVPMAGSSALVPRATFETVGGFDARLSTSADWDFCYRLARRQRIGFVPEALIAVRQHRTNMHANIRLMEHDMLLAYAKAFSDLTDRGGFRRQAYGNLHTVLARCFFQAGEPLKAIEHSLRSLWLSPANLPRLAGFPLRGRSNP